MAFASPNTRKLSAFQTGLRSRADFTTVRRRRPVLRYTPWRALTNSQAQRTYTMQCIFNGFQQSGTLRSFAFTVVSENVPRIQVAVGVDTAVSRKFGISLQELPLICRETLSSRYVVGANSALTVGEEELLEYVR